MTIFDINFCVSAVALGVSFIFIAILMYYAGKWGVYEHKKHR